jgi:hypothetical protein
MTHQSDEKWTIEKVMALGREEVIELWKTLPAPDFEELTGEYTGHVPDGGDEKLRAQVAKVMFNESSALGFWLGKAYKALSPTKGEGYNCWRKPGDRVVRNLRFGTEAGTSLIDGKPALIMRYGDFKNPSGDADLTDEIRKLDDGLYLGVGTTATPDGKRSPPGHFALSGPIGRWLGVDDESAERK